MRNNVLQPIAQPLRVSRRLILIVMRQWGGFKQMELKEFVTETLVQISEGVEEAQSDLKSRGSEAVVNTSMTETNAGHVVTGGKRRPVEYVDFDVAILASEDTETKAGIGLTVASLLSLDAGGKSTQSGGRESRIRFRVPMSYPMHKWVDNSEDA